MRKAEQLYAFRFVSKSVLADTLKTSHSLPESAATMMLKIICFALSFCAVVSVTTMAYAQATAVALKPGEYVTDNGWGTLTLKAGRAGALSFSLQTVGGNMHTCSLEGEVRDGQATRDGPEEKEPCVVTFRIISNGIQVGPKGPGSCSDYCGMRASFEGVYATPARGCDRASVAANRKTFQQLYSARQFAEAKAKLQPLLRDCSRTLSEVEDGRIRNDLAVTLHKLGELEACRELLASLAEEAKLTDAQLRDNYLPSDADVRISLMRATRTNLKLCAAR